MPTPTSGNTYRFRSNTTAAVNSSRSVGYYLNCYGTTSGSTVNGYRRDGTRDQIWNFDGTRLTHEKSGTSICLSRSGTTATAVQIGSTSLATSLSQISFEQISGNNYRVKVGGTTSPMYLTATPTTNSANASITLSWAALKSSDSTNSQSWEVERLIKVTGFPSGLYTNNTEFFHPSAGWTQGTYTGNGGATKLANAIALYRKCYNLSSSATVTNSQVFTNLYGAMTVGSGTWQDGSIHLGYDFNRGLGTEIYAPYAGTVQNAPYASTYGAVALYANSRYYHLLHMDPVSVSQGVSVTTANVIGKEGRAGVSQVHLHIEAATSNSTSVRSPLASTNSSLPTLNLL